MNAELIIREAARKVAYCSQRMAADWDTHVAIYQTTEKATVGATEDASERPAWNNIATTIKELCEETS